MRWTLLAVTALALGPTLTFAEEISGQGSLLSVTLDNGLQVTILSDFNNPVVCTQVWYHVGSANEGPSSRGFAHLFEHLMFGRTRTMASDEYSRHHHDHGGRDNAYTSFDETVYVSEIAPEHHRRVLEMEADRMVNLVLEAENLENEKRIVTEELRQSTENDPRSRVMVAALKAVLEDHPYAHPPVGTESDIAAATLEHCRVFYERYYRPRNAHLVVVGPVDGALTLAAVREIFGAIPAGGETPVDVPPLLGRTFPRGIIELTEDLPPAEIAMIGYPLPPAGGADHWAIEVLRQLLGGGSVDPFEEVLVKRRRKAIYGGTQWLLNRRGGALVFTAAYVPYRRRSTGFRLMAETVDELGRLQWLDASRLGSAKRALARREMERVFYSRKRAEAIGQSAWWLGDARLALESVRRIDAVSRHEVESVYARYVTGVEPVRLYIKPEHVPVWIRLFGWVYPLVSP